MERTFRVHYPQVSDTLTEQHRRVATLTVSAVVLAAAVAVRMSPSVWWAAPAAVVLCVGIRHAARLFQEPLQQLEVSSYRVAVGDRELHRGQGDGLAVVAGVSMFGHIVRRLVVTRNRMPVAWLDVKQLRLSPDEVLAALGASGWPVPKLGLRPAPRSVPSRSCAVPFGVKVMYRCVRVAAWMMVAVFAFMSAVSGPTVNVWAAAGAAGVLTVVVMLPSVIAGVIAGWYVHVGVNDTDFLVRYPAGTFSVPKRQVGEIVNDRRGLWVHTTTGRKVKITGPVSNRRLTRLRLMLGTDVPVRQA